MGEYVQAHEDENIKNNNAPRSLDCLYLRPTANHQGGYELLHLQTNRTILRSKVTAVAITPSVIKMVHVMAVKDKMPDGLKVKNRANAVIFDASLTARVDYNEELFDEELIEEQFKNPNYESSKSEESEDEISIDEESQEHDDMDDNELADVLEEQYVLQDQEEVEKIL